MNNDNQTTVAVVEIQNVAPINIIENSAGVYRQRAEAIAKFKDFIMSEFVDGVDYGKLPRTKIATLLLPGAEKIQQYLGLLPEYTIISQKEERTVSEDKRGFFSYQVECSLCYDNRKVSTAVGSANTSEDKYLSKSAESMANTVLKIAYKRAFVSAVKAVAGVSDLFTVDLEDNEATGEISKLKVNAANGDKDGKIGQRKRKELCSYFGAFGMNGAEQQSVLREFGYATVYDVEVEKYTKVVQRIAEVGKAKKAAEAEVKKDDEVKNDD